MMNDVLAIVVGYLFGSIPFGYIIACAFGIPDIRKYGSGNIGATNAWRVAGPTAGILVAVCDIGKGVLTVLVASYLGGQLLAPEYVKLLAGLAAVLGHLFPVFLLFKGGKGVNTALGVMVTLVPGHALLALAVFVLVVVISRYISLGSILAAAAFILSILIGKLAGWSDVHPVYIPAGLVLALLIVIAHRSNIKRLLDGKENRFSFRSRTEGEVKSNA
ncbi:MAG: glycerol-3-phosphate 1-O-acyltransferase PlsY [Candidatus Zixiibacteriota bacterium]|nr:MAG: glycerol-3-phosphate 1-O-acyltransferase PlsY [candidate division Zixibacteria bacterium]